MKYVRSGQECAGAGCPRVRLPVSCHTCSPHKAFLFYFILNSFSVFPVLIALIVYKLQIPEQRESTTEKKAAGYQTTNSVALVRKRTIPTERPPLFDEVSAY
jgi:hypothetical protein